MIGVPRKREKVDPRVRIRELFEARDAAKAAHVAAEERIEQLERKRAELEASLLGLETAVKDREYDWRLSQVRLDVGEATPEAVATAEKAFDDADVLLKEAKGKLGAMEDMIADAQNQLPSLKLAEEAAARRPWDAISEQMGPDVQEAAAVIRRFYVSELNRAVFGIPADVFLRGVVGLGDVAAIAVVLEAEYRG